jgi:protein-tyrosine phosphatase
MIDMHNHVLYGVDDGAENLTDSLAMIEAAVSAGFDTLVLTPHYMTYRGYTAAPEFCNQRKAEIETALLKNRVPVRLIAGNELLYDYDLLRAFDAGKFQPIGATDYYLIETTRQGGSALALQNFMHQLHRMGKKTILAHPERYDFVQDDPNVLLDFMAAGTLIQGNYLSLLDYYDHATTAAFKIMLEHQMVQLVASDAHQAEGYALYPEAAAVGREMVGEEAWQRLTTVHPRAVLANEKIPPRPVPYKKPAAKTVIGSPGGWMPW